MIPHEFSARSTTPYGIAQYRAKTHTLFVPSLIRKRCACGAVVTALQLSRFGRCEKCVRAA